MRNFLLRAFALFFGFGGVSSAQISVEDIMADASFYGAELSPSGRYLAGVILQDDNRIAMVLDLQQEEKAVEYMQLPDSFINWIEWADDDRLIMSITNYVNRGGRTVPISDLLNDPDLVARPIRRLMAIDRDQSNPVILLEGSRRLKRNLNRARVTDFLVDDPSHILMPAILRGHLDLFKVNLADGSHERIASGGSDTIGWFTDDDGVPAFRLDANRRFTKLTFYARESRNDGKIKWKKARTIRLDTRRGSDDEDQVEFRPIHPGPDSNTYYVVARPDDTDTSGIYLYDFEADEFIETLASHPEVDITTGIFYEKSRDFAGYAFYEDRLAYQMKDRELQNHIDGLNAYFGNELNLQIADQSADDNLWLIYVSGPTDSGSWHIYNVDKHDIRELGGRMQNLPRAELAPMQVVNYTARDGLALTGYLTRPKGIAADAQPPLIMLPHGGPEARDYFVYNSEVQMFAALGYQVFQPNFRGSDGYGASFVQKGRREFGRAMQDDIDDGYQNLVDVGFVEQGNACIVGSSYGGYAALMGAVRDAGDYKCAISTAGPTNLYKMLRWIKAEDGRDSDTYDYWVEQLGDPREDRKMMEEVSPERRADEIMIPVLMIHGDGDNIVPKEETKRMKSALERAGKDAEYVKLPDSGHSYRSREDEETERRAVVRFLHTHMPTDSSTVAVQE